MTKLEEKTIDRVHEILKGETLTHDDCECCVLSDAEECYKEGYKDAFKDISEWLKTNHIDYSWWDTIDYEMVYDTDNMIDDIKKFLEL